MSVDPIEDGVIEAFDLSDVVGTRLYPDCRKVIGETAYKRLGIRPVIFIRFEKPLEKL